MTVKQLVQVLNTDEFIMIDDVLNEWETIRGYEKGSYKALKKYYDVIVVDITPCGNAVEIRFIKERYYGTKNTQKDWRNYI